jgi:hypothetical protein
LRRGREFGHFEGTANTMSKFYLAAACSFFLISGSAVAQEGGRQIRLDKNTCKNVSAEIRNKLGGYNMKKALAAQKAGHVNAEQKMRLNELQFLRGAMRSVKCKNIP